MSNSRSTSDAQSKVPKKPPVNEPRTHGSLIRGGKRGSYIGVHCLLDHNTNKMQATD